MAETEPTEPAPVVEPSDGLTPNVTLPPVEIPVAAVNETPANETPASPLPPIEEPVNVTPEEPAPVSPGQQCVNELECTLGEDGKYNFDCYFDESSMTCRCYTGGIENCPRLLAENESLAGEGEPEEAKFPGVRYYGIAAFVLLVVAFFAYRALSSKEEEPARPKKAEKAEKAKAEKPSKEDDVIDLEEFFEKKENKKK